MVGSIAGARQAEPAELTVTHSWWKIYGCLSPWPRTSGTVSLSVFRTVVFCVATSKGLKFQPFADRSARLQNVFRPQLLRVFLKEENRTFCFLPANGLMMRLAIPSRTAVPFPYTISTPPFVYSSASSSFPPDSFPILSLS